VSDNREPAGMVLLPTEKVQSIICELEEWRQSSNTYREALERMTVDWGAEHQARCLAELRVLELEEELKILKCQEQSKST